MSLLDGKTAVITGGSSGIGRGIAQTFAHHGADGIVNADIDEEPKEGGTPTHELIQDETDTEAVYVETDVADRNSFAQAIDATEPFGGIDILVNNAGIWRVDNFLEVTEEEYATIMEINLKGAFFGSQLAARQMVDSDGGSIINISSIAGLFGNGNWPTYAASKGGLTMLTSSLAHRFGPEGIRVNAIHPGGIETNIGGDDDISPEVAEAFLETVPLGRYGKPDEIGDAALFLASDLSTYVTGESLVVDGGWTCWK